MLTKSKVLETLASFPEDFSLDTLMEQLILIEKVEKALQQIQQQQTVTQEDAKKQFVKWLS